MVLRPTEPDYAASQLASTVRIALANYDPRTHAEAIAGALQDLQNAGMSRGGRGIGAVVRYLDGALKTRARKSTAAIAEDMAEAIAQEARLRKRLDGIATGGTKRRRGGETWDDAWQDVERERAQA
jgi:hypothetical protein